ncbi:MAG: lysostaphin resistance A-like protein [Candidatus Polarisedimenticolia bacterium]
MMESARRSTWSTAAELALVVLIYLADLEGLVPLSKTIPFFALGWISLRMRRLRWRDVGLARPPSWPRAILIGTMAGIALELFSTYVTVPAISGWAGSPPDLHDMRPMVGNLSIVLAMTLLNWTLAAFGEEMVYRGYLMNLVAGIGRGTRAAWAISLIVVSASFGFGHDYQGLTGMIQESLAGLALGLIYLACGRNLTIPIITHGVSNQLAFLLIYFDRYPGV